MTTKDHYKLTVFRIPGKLGTANQEELNQPGPPVLLQHGFIDSADGWVAHDKESMAFVLSDAGYDVWLGNVRGNKYSRGHTYYNASKDYDYWQFSWEENGLYDVPAMLDYITENTRYEKVAYFGHSMGNTLAIFGMTELLSYY